jgi:hypothetical protein
MSRNLLHKVCFQRAWLIMSMVIGILGILSGIYLCAFGHLITGLGGVFGGMVMTFTGYVGLRSVGRGHRKSSLTHV